jgi:hypothetical protein
VNAERAATSAHVDAIAARAGTCRTVVKDAIREAQRLGLLVRIERRRAGWPWATNIIRICSREWLAWLRIGPGVGKATTHGQQEFKKNGD